ncbi:MAG: hypothetical protein AMXMBFR12_08430 [Candidatus Babeliales bacterium]
MKRLIMEFLGTFFLVLAFALTSNPIAIAAMLMAWIYIGSHVSGAHYNPAVSLAHTAAGYSNWGQFLWYSLAQILGGFAAFLTAYNLVGQVAIPVPANGVSLGQALATEILLAFVFALVILVVTHTKHFRPSTIAGFVIGFTIPALALVGGPISGGLFNPAISLGANILALAKGVAVIWPNVLMYVGGALLGGFLASFAFHYLIPADQH